VLAIFAGLVLLRACLVAARSLAEARYHSEFVNRLRRRAWQALLRCDWRAAIRMHRAQTTALLISNIDRLGTAMYQALQVAAGAATLGVLLAATLLVAPLLGSAALIAGAVILLAYRRARRDAAQLGERVGVAYDAIHAAANEGLGHLRAIKSLGLERQFLARAEVAFADLAAQLIAFTRRSGVSAIILQGGGAIVLAAGIWAAVRWGGAGLSTIVPLAALAARALPLLGQIQSSWQNFVFNGGVAAQTLALIAEAEAGAEAAPDPTAAAPRLTRSLSLSRVTVRFAGQARAALEAADLVIPVR
jgi:ATP-binding cassette subfamily C protein